MSKSQVSTAANTQQPPAKRRHKSMAKIKLSTVAIYISVFALIVTAVTVGYREPKKTTATSNVANSSTIAEIDQTSVDNVVATAVAADVAETTNLPIANSVSSMAVSAVAKNEFLQSDTASVTKPQIIESTEANRKVINCTVKAEDTIDSLAAKFNISKQTIKWANDLTSDNIITDTVLKILPFDGVLYSVKDGDTIDSIASKYKVDKNRLVLKNDLDVGGLTPGTQIILPNGVLPTEERPGYVAPVTYFAYAGTGAGFGGRTWYIASGTGPCPSYAYGNCTCYAYNRRVQLGLPVGTNWGNAGSWAWYARQAGLTVNGTPTIGAVIQDSGHVAIVENVLANGDLSISEMNAYVYGGGFNIVSGRIVPAGNVGQYLYIH